MSSLSDIRIRARRRWAAVPLLALALVACEDDTPLMAPQPKSTAKAKASASASADADDAPKIPIMEFTEADFVESEDSRDPYRDYSYLFVKTNRENRPMQRKVKASGYSLDELNLTAIITRGRPSVMLTDQSGFGWVLYVGDYVGKPELVSAGGTDGTEVAINWRVDRIRTKDVVFIREDSAHPDIPPTTRVIPLYATGEDT